MLLPRTFLPLLLSALAAAPASGQDSAEFQRRRAALLERMGSGSLLVVRGAAASRRDAEFRQRGDFFYLTGLDRPGGILLLWAGAPRGEGARIYSAHRKEAARLGFTVVRPESRFSADLAKLLDKPIARVYLPRTAGRRGPSRRAAPPEQGLVERARQGGREIELKATASRLIGELRAIKSPTELASLRKAIDITCAAHRALMRAARAGMNEGRLQRILEKVFRQGGSVRNGFDSIVGSGPNGCILHWSKNNRTTRPGDLVVVDIGAEYASYSADVTRTIPIRGKFSKRQRAIYEIVLRANEECLAMVAPGVHFSQISKRASRILFEGLEALGVIDNPRDLRKYYYHGLGHNIGLAVHDPGPLDELKPGMVFTIEPGLYFRDEGMGIRIEDDVLVTQEGHEVLSSAAPKAISAIEALMAGRALPRDEGSSRGAAAGKQGGKGGQQGGSGRQQQPG